MTEKEIRILLLLVDVSQVSIAKKLGIPRSAVHQVITGLRSNQRIRQAIADAVGRPVEKLWPQTDPQNDPNEHVNSNNSIKPRLDQEKKGSKRAA